MWMLPEKLTFSPENNHTTLLHESLNWIYAPSLFLIQFSPLPFSMRMESRPVQLLKHIIKRRKKNGNHVLLGESLEDLKTLTVTVWPIALMDALPEWTKNTLAAIFWNHPFQKYIWKNELRNGKRWNSQSIKYSMDDCYIFFSLN